MEHYEDKDGTIICIRAVRGPRHGVTINPTLISVKEIPLKWKENIFHTGNSSNSRSISENGLWAGGSRLRSKRQACFCSTLLTRQRTIDWTEPVHEPSMVLYKQSYRPDHVCISYFNLRRAQDAHLVFHQSSTYSIILNDNMRASALDIVVTFAGEILFERKPPTLTKSEDVLKIEDRVHCQNMLQISKARRDIL